MAPPPASASGSPTACLMVLAVLTAVLTAVASTAAGATALPDCFLSMGDWGSANPHVAAMSLAMQRMASAPADVGCASIAFILALGDNFYDSGVSTTHDPQWKSTLVDQFRAPNSSLATMRIYAIAGNHDYDAHDSTGVTQSKVQAQIDYQAVDPYWIFPSRNYTVDQTLSGQQIRFLMADTEPMHLCAAESEFCFDPYEPAWIDAELANADHNDAIEAVVFVGHHNILTPIGGHRDYALDGMLVPILQRHRVTVSLMAHSHYVSWGQNKNLSGSAFSEGALWHITNGAARGSDFNDCEYPADTPLFNTMCLSASNNEAGAFMLHRVLVNATGMEHCVHGSVSGAQLACVTTDYRRRASPLPGASSEPPLFSIKTWTIVGACVGGVVLVMAVVAIVMIRRKQAVRRRAHSSLLFTPDAVFSAY